MRSAAASAGNALRAAQREDDAAPRPRSPWTPQVDQLAEPVRSWRSVRVRLQLLAVVPVLAIATLGVLQVNATTDAMDDAGRARRIASTVIANSRLAHELEREYAETQAFADRGGRTGGSLVAAQQARTDLALDRYRRRGADTGAGVPGFAQVLGEADAALGRLPGIRQLAAGSDDQATGYRTIVSALLAVADALPAQLANRALADQVQAIAALSAIEHHAALQRDLLRATFARGSLKPGDIARLAQLTAAEGERRAAFERVADEPARERFRELMAGADVEAAARMKAATLAAETDPARLPQDSDAWYVAQSHTIRRLHLLVLELSERLDRAAADAQRAARQRVVTTAAVLALVLAATLAATLFLAAHVSRRLRRLRDSALAVAHDELPATVNRLAQHGDRDRMLTVELQATQQADSALTGGPPDEIAQVAAAFAAVHDEAVRLATEQAVARLDNEMIFISLARRSQVLVQRQLRLIDDLEEREADPEALDNLYRLDHLAARMRRISENLLVLAGTEPVRTLTSAVALLDVLRAAASEIEHYDRVDAGTVAEVGVVAQVAGDLVHLLAELLENATANSPPDTRVRMSAAVRIGHGLRIYVEDEGIGVSAQDLDTANARLAAPGRLTGALASTMGLLVVARLAERHGIGVRLHAHGERGTIAVITVPDSALAASPPAISLAEPPRQRPAERPVRRALVAAGMPSTPPAAVSWGADLTAIVVDTGPAEITQSGLPRRQPGARLVPGAAPAGPGADADRDLPDPDEVRARLTALARGVAAARRVDDAAE